jgi:hypothetical protein
MRPVRHGGWRRLGCSVLALSLVLEGRVVFAADPPQAVVREFALGKAAYDRGDYGQAAKIWHAASKQLPDQQLRARARLVLDVATALEREFDANGTRRSLEGAREFVAWYGEQVDAAYADAAERAREHARASDRLARIDAKLLAKSETPRKPDPDPVFDDDDHGQRERRKHGGMIGGGVFMTLLGVGGIGMIAAGLLTHRKWLAGLGGGVAVAFGITGPVLIGFGARRRKAALSAKLERAPRLGITAGRGFGGLTLGGRF